MARDLRRGLEQQAAGLPVRFAGQVKADEFLASHDVLVVSSRFEEPFGRILIEGWAQGLPVLCARRGGAQELVEEDRTGWLFDPDHPEELAGLLDRVSTGISERQREICRQRAQDFTPQRCLEAYQQVYEESLVQAGQGLAARHPA